MHPTTVIPGLITPDITDGMILGTGIGDPPGVHHGHGDRPGHGDHHGVGTGGLHGHGDHHGAGDRLGVGADARTMQIIVPVEDYLIVPVGIGLPTHDLAETEVMPLPAAPVETEFPHMGIPTTAHLEVAPPTITAHIAAQQLVVTA